MLPRPSMLILHPKCRRSIATSSTAKEGTLEPVRRRQQRILEEKYRERVVGVDLGVDSDEEIDDDDSMDEYDSDDDDDDDKDCAATRTTWTRTLTTRNARRCSN